MWRIAKSRDGISSRLIRYALNTVLHTPDSIRLAVLRTPYSVLSTEQPEIPARHVHRPKRQVLGARLATAETLVPAFPFHHSI